MNSVDVAIIGSGPYGLSIAAHLRAAGVNFRIFGHPMEFWRGHMPQGMHLKSEGFASSLYDPGSTFTLKHYCKEKGIAYADIGSPVPLEVFWQYGMEFQKRFVPSLEHHKVSSVSRAPNGFRVTLDTGESFQARRVVVAVGLTYFPYVPPELAALPSNLLTHSSKHSDNLGELAGKEVAIVGAGSSAIDLAALLHQAGASVQVLARVAKIRFHDPPDNLTPNWLDKVREPITGIGPGWKLFWCSNLPLVFRRMPEKFRIEKVRQILGPAPCWFTKEQVIGKVGFKLGVSVSGTSVENGRVKVELLDKTGQRTTITADHVIAATGYRVDLQRLTFLDNAILSGLQRVDKSPALSSNFESSERNLYFVGIPAANTFGPLLRFAFGAGFASQRISRHLKHTAKGRATGMEASHQSTEVSEEETVEPAVR